MSGHGRKLSVRTLLFGRQGGYIAFIFFSIPVIYLFGFRHMSFFMVPSGSMEPTLMTGDYLVTLTAREYRRGDVVVTKDPEEAGAFIVKRIVGIAGDTVAIEGGALYVDGQYVSEPYISKPPEYVLHPFTIPEGRVFLLGDNRNNSEDAHAWTEKAQPAENIVGRVRYIYYPYNRARTFAQYAIGIAAPADSAS